MRVCELENLLIDLRFLFFTFGIIEIMPVASLTGSIFGF